MYPGRNPRRIGSNHRGHKGTQRGLEVHSRRSSQCQRCRRQAFEGCGPNLARRGRRIDYAALHLQVMSDNRPPTALDELLLELLAAIKANGPVANGFKWNPDDREHNRGWEVWDGDCAARMRSAAAALKRLAATDTQNLAPDKVVVLQELLAAIDEAKPTESGTGHCPEVPIFDHHDSKAESERARWEMLDRKHGDHVRTAAAALQQMLQISDSSLLIRFYR